MNTDQLQFAKLIADDTRNVIIDHLCCAWLSVNGLVEKLGGKVNQPTVSHHLKKLEEAGLVIVRDEGRQRFYTLNRDQYNLCCGQLFRKGNPGQEMQIVSLDAITIRDA